MFVFPTSGMRDAFRFADTAHAGQVRKYIGTPYITHPVAVARLVMRFDHDEAMVMAALLHDVEEDCGVLNAQIAANFGADVASLVSDLTDVSKLTDGNRAIRKEIDRRHTAAAQPRAKSIKACDLAHNCRSIVKYAGGSSRNYVHEKGLLLPVLVGASDPRAVELASRVHQRAVRRLAALSAASASGGRRMVA